MPFCQVRRLTSTNSAEPSACRPKRFSTAVRLAARPCSLRAENGAASSGSVSGFQTSVSMPLTMPCSTPDARR